VVALPRFLQGIPRKRLIRREGRLNLQEISMDIANKTVLITGANRGIGQALVAEALRRGAKRVYAGTRGAPLTADPRVTPLLLDVTNAAQVRQAAAQIEHLDVLVNNAGIALYDDLGKLDVIQQHLEVNLFGLLRVTNAFLPLLEHSKGALVNNLSIVALAGMPIIPSYSISKAAALNLTQSLRALLAGDGVSVHGVMLGPIDTEMNRGLDIPKASTESTARAIFDGLARGEEEIFPDPVSQSIAAGWRAGVAKALEGQFKGFVPARAA
jgi:NAD(P)-dependent dehydrogenase (short-subunit alcohol dehydrogenase family)